jgi:ATP synthase protein I
MKDDKDRNQIARAFSLFMQLGMTMATCILIGFGIGRFLDNRLGTSPWLMLLFLIFGIGAAIKILFDLSKDWN